METIYHHNHPNPKPMIVIHNDTVVESDNCHPCVGCKQMVAEDHAECLAMLPEPLSYIIIKDCPNIGKEHGDIYSDEYGKDYDTLIAKGVIELELTTEEYEAREALNN